MAQGSPAISVRDVHGPDELRACQDVQRRAWGISEDGYIVPVATMAAAQKVGGLVLGAFEAHSERLIGFAFAFLGKLHGRLILYSQLTGVDPDSQGTGVGRRLKLEQRTRAGEMGLPAVVWAFDPLQASNAAFNLAVLGARSRTYEVDLYGSRSDVLNLGLATDRLLAEWSTTGVAHGRTDPWPDAFELIQTHPDPGGAARRSVTCCAIPADAVHLHLEIPPSIAEVKAHTMAATARDWQIAVREAFQAAFAAGFLVIGLTRADPLRPRYLLERTP